VYTTETGNRANSFGQTLDSRLSDCTSHYTDSVISFLSVVSIPSTSHVSHPGPLHVSPMLPSATGRCVIRQLAVRRPLLGDATAFMAVWQQSHDECYAAAATGQSEMPVSVLANSGIERDNERVQLAHKRDNPLKVIKDAVRHSDRARQRQQPTHALPCGTEHIAIGGRPRNGYSS